MRLLALEPQVLVRRGVRVPRDEGEARLCHARPVAVEEGQLPDGREHRLVVDELLDAMEDRLPLFRVDLARLFLDEPLAVWIMFFSFLSRLFAMKATRSSGRSCVRMPAALR